MGTFYSLILKGNTEERLFREKRMVKELGLPTEGQKRNYSESKKDNVHRLLD